jgi:hypothetical protein
MHARGPHTRTLATESLRWATAAQCQNAHDKVLSNACCQDRVSITDSRAAPFICGLAFRPEVRSTKTAPHTPRASRHVVLLRQPYLFPSPATGRGKEPEALHL